MDRIYVFHHFRLRIVLVFSPNQESNDPIRNSVPLKMQETPTMLQIEKPNTIERGMRFKKEAHCLYKENFR